MFTTLLINSLVDVERKIQIETERRRNLGAEIPEGHPFTAQPRRNERKSKLARQIELDMDCQPGYPCSEPVHVKA